MDLKKLFTIFMIIAAIWFIISNYSGSSNSQNHLMGGGTSPGVYTQLTSDIGPEDSYLISPDYDDYDGYDLYDYYNPYGNYLY